MKNISKDQENALFGPEDHEAPIVKGKYYHAPGTPGPYRAEGGAVKAISHGRWFTVARVDRGKFTPEGREENARLLASAPTMYSLLGKCHDFLADLIIDDETERDALLDEIWEAIKPKGGE